MNENTAILIIVISSILTVIFLFGWLLVLKNRKDKKYFENQDAINKAKIERALEPIKKEAKYNITVRFKAILDNDQEIDGVTIPYQKNADECLLLFNAPNEREALGYKNDVLFLEGIDSMGFTHYCKYPSGHVREFKILSNENI